MKKYFIAIVVLLASAMGVSAQVSGS